MRVRTGLVAVVVVCVVLAGCGGGSKLAGTWQDVSGAVTLEFKSGKVTVTVNGESETGPYKIEGNKIAIATANLNPESDFQTYTVTEDTLTLGDAPNMMTFKKANQ